MTTELLIGYSILLGLFFTNFAIARLSRNLRKERDEQELAQIFLWFWDGTPEDRLYAWYKVRTILRQREGEKRRIEVVDRKISDLNKQQMLGAVYVSETGELIDKDLTSSVES